MILPQEIIRHKRDGAALTTAELESFFYGFLRGEVADYQVAAMLMAITLKGMNERETADLTRLMRDSGETFSWPYEAKVVVDKHSTGGIGDKTSIVLVPLCILEGLRIPMMAGRGLGHTGGTLDKLEGVGWKVYMTPAAARAQVERLGGVFMGQTEQVTPLDRRLYSMRDVTSTVESIPLIVGSILSKKLAEGLGGLVMDVKYGSGAFMQELADARQLAAALKRVGNECGLNIRCLLTDMNSPLGRTAGNALEIYEAIELLQGKGPADARELTLALGVEMVRLAFPERPAAAVRARLEQHLASGAAFALFLQLAEAQGGDLSLLTRPETLRQAPLRHPVILAGGRYVTAIDTRSLGLAVVELGGGRRLVADKINPWVGLSDLKRVGEAVAPGEPVAVVHAADAAQANAAALMVASAYRLGDTAKSAALIAEML